MSPRLLQNEIHQDFRDSSGVWIDYKNQIVANFSNINTQDLNDHLLREFNRKIQALNQSTSLMFTPFDAGFRFLGNSVEPLVYSFFILNSDGTDRLIRPVNDATTENIIAPDQTLYNVEP